MTDVLLTTIAPTLSVARMKRSPYGIVKHPAVTVIKSPTQPPSAAPHDSWPAWALAVERLRATEDVGVGDTIKRLLGSVGTLFEVTLRAMGAPCRCPERKDTWNAMFTYPKTQ